MFRVRVCTAETELGHAHAQAQHLLDHLAHASVWLLSAQLLLPQLLLISHRTPLPNHPIQSNFQHPRLPHVSTKHVHSPTRIFRRRQEHCAISPRAIIRPERNIGAEDGASLSEEVFEVLPADAVGELEGNE